MHHLVDIVDVNVIDCGLHHVSTCKWIHRLKASYIALPCRSLSCIYDFERKATCCACHQLCGPARFATNGHRCHPCTQGSQHGAFLLARCQGLKMAPHGTDAAAGTAIIARGVIRCHGGHLPTSVMPVGGDLWPAKRVHSQQLCARTC
jgi:hypothetical protein